MVNNKISAGHNLGTYSLGSLSLGSKRRKFRLRRLETFQWRAFSGDSLVETLCNEDSTM